MTVAIVLAGGDPVDPQVRHRLPDANYVVAADSGVHAARGLGLRVDRLIGDLDSADPAVVEEMLAAGTRLDRHAPAKDATDLELALHDVVASGADHIVLVGGAGGRLDHLLANLLLLCSPQFAGRRIEGIVGDAWVALARGGTDPVSISGSVGMLVTVLPACGPAVGVRTSGLEYPLDGEDLPCGTSRGVSNVMTGATATVGLDRGTLLIVQPDGGRARQTEGGRR